MMTLNAKTKFGRFDEGLAEGRRAIELDPFSLIANMAKRF